MIFLMQIIRKKIEKKNLNRLNFLTLKDHLKVIELL